jgi:transcription elongation factor GreA
VGDGFEQALRHRPQRLVSSFNSRGATVLTAGTANRPTDDPALMTQEGYDRLQSELLTLTTTTRRELAVRLSEARAARANPAENGELIDALDQCATLEQRIGELKARLAAARVAAPACDDGVAAIGTRVGLRTGDGQVLHYELVGAGEADPARWRISISSPVGVAIAGRSAGDQIDVDTPRRRVRFDLVSVEPLGGQLAKAA